MFPVVGSSDGSPGDHSPNSSPQASPVPELCHALSFVNKVKNCFQGQPNIYKQFVEILQTYFNDQKNFIDGVKTETKPLTAAEVCAKVAELFQDQPDLLQEFGYFLPVENDDAFAPFNFVGIYEILNTIQSSGGSPGVCSSNSTTIEIPASLSEEFNHAIQFVLKVKTRFQGQPDTYKQFLGILGTYKEEQTNLKNGVKSEKEPLTAAEVCAKVAELFQNQDDLLQEFAAFLPKWGF